MISNKWATRPNLTGTGSIYFRTGAYQVQAAVTSADTATVQICAVVATTALSGTVAFNVAVE